jgi:hypothetical protein
MHLMKHSTELLTQSKATLLPNSTVQLVQLVLYYLLALFCLFKQTGPHETACICILFNGLTDV